MTSSFIFLTCQVGAEGAVKRELARQWPAFRFAYSRPGFLTFKLPPDAALADDFDLRSIFARSYGFSLGKVVGASTDELAAGAVRLAAGRTFGRLHVFARDAAAPGEHDFEPGFTPASREAEAAIRRAWAAAMPMPPPRRRMARPGDRVLDCVLVEPNEWWLGWHRARGWASRRPGGLNRLRLPDDAVSRAYLKMEEALRWSRLPIEAGQRAVELGCSPGGSCQALLHRKLQVTGIDPAEMHPAVMANPHFIHVRKRGADVRRRDFRGVDWLLADMNVAPAYTLDTVEVIVRHPSVNVSGMLLMLKLIDWRLADDAPAYLQRVRSWGFPYVRARQLQYNRQEFCIAALRRKPRPPKGGLHAFL